MICGLESEMEGQVFAMDGEKAYEEWMADVMKREQEVEARVQRMRYWKASGGWTCADTGGCVGLRNLRNTCWMNSVLQSLAHVEPLTALLLQLRAGMVHSYIDEEAPPSPTHAPPVTPRAPRNRRTSLDLKILQDDTDLQVAYQFIELLHNLWQIRQTEGALAPAILQRALRTKAPYLFPRGIQQDANDFFVYLINVLDEELKEVQPIKELVSSCFQGEMRSSLTCQECGFSSQKPEPFQTLSLPVQCEAFQEVDLSEILKSFCVEEVLEGRNSWKCEKCDRPVRATKKLEVVKLPRVLVLHLKRFAFDKLCNRVQKVQAQITVKEGLDALNLSQYIHGYEGDPVFYDIIGTVNHHGPDATSGHYTAHCRNCVYDEWYTFNDDEVNRIGADTAWRAEEVYLVFLLRREAREASGSA